MDIREEILIEMKTQNDDNLLSLSFEKPVLLVFLRHFGCVFCKEAMEDLGKLRPIIEKSGFHLILAHMAENNVAEDYFAKYSLNKIQHISNPSKTYYTEFNLRKGSIGQLYGLKTWYRGFSQENKSHKLEMAKSLGDSTQMPGIFTISDGKIIDSYIHKYAADKPDYTKLLECCIVK